MPVARLINETPSLFMLPKDDHTLRRTLWVPTWEGTERAPRDADETPRFVRVEVILNSAVFCVTFTDAEYYPAPIRIDNQSDVPVLYQQQSEGPIGQHLRTICKARSHVDYAWDDLYGSRRIVLQVYENKSNVYDPSQPGIGPQLVYENNAYIQLTSSFNSYNISNSKKTDDHEQVLETMQKGKVMLNKQNRVDANNGNQLWVICKDGCIENVGMSNRSKIRMVLDVLERMGYQLMMTPRSTSRDRYQKWTLSPDGRLWCRGVTNMSVTYRAPDIVLAPNDSVDADVNADSNQESYYPIPYLSVLFSPFFNVFSRYGGFNGRDQVAAR
ncbi:unnamed protein product [Nippostrongylus brasiliensis]|uniref:SHR-BD domain-containing protein n=1 Tax=Nippostrongylus brasiliensis TaxID=27835 RepID=A0A0N4YVA2_NIPBR|nr:unnamed protein product [Nippostrongylus brasiliensis]